MARKTNVCVRVIGVTEYRVQILGLGGLFYWKCISTTYYVLRTTNCDIFPLCLSTLSSCSPARLSRFCRSWDFRQAGTPYCFSLPAFLSSGLASRFGDASVSRTREREIRPRRKQHNGLPSLMRTMGMSPIRDCGRRTPFMLLVCRKSMGPIIRARSWAGRIASCL